MTPLPASRQRVEEQNREKGRPARDSPGSLEPEVDVDLPTDPVPEADDARVKRAWEETESMEGPAPTG